MRGRCAPGFAERLRNAFAPEDLDRHPWPVFGIVADGALAYVNPAWDAFARANGGEPAVGRKWNLGSNFFAAVAPVLHPFYRDLFARAASTGHALQPPAHVYECSSAREFRQFSMQVFALPGNGGYVVLNSLVVAHPHDAADRPPHAADLARYTDTNGLMRQCAHCRRMQQAAASDRWDWVPTWVEEQQPNISHGICPLCYAYYYAKRRLRDA